MQRTPKPWTWNVTKVTSKTRTSLRVRVMCESRFIPLGENETIEFNRRVPKLYVRDGSVDFSSRLRDAVNTCLELLGR